MKKLLPLVLALGCAYGTRFEVNDQRRVEDINVQDKYALIVVGSSDIGNYYGIPDSQNPFNLEGRAIKADLMRNGFPEDNIYLIDSDHASYSNLLEATGELSRKVDNNDAFIAVISSHGTPFAIEMQNDGIMMSNGRLEDALENIHPEVGILYIDACYSGNIISSLDLPDYVKISSTESGELSYSDTFFSGSRNFISALFDENSDSNNDEKITIAEAFEASNASAARYQEARRGGMADEASFKQQMYYGENASPYWYIAEEEEDD